MENCDWHVVYDFWLPAELADGSLDFHKSMGEWRMQGGATPQLAPFAGLVDAASAGRLNDWPATAHGRLSLTVVLDQFPRGLFTGTERAYAYDKQALKLCEVGLANGHYAELRYPWECFFFTLPLLHAEGPDHLERLYRLKSEADAGTREAVRAYSPLRPIFEFSLSQLGANLEVISRFGRFPHRNAILGRASTADELAYIEKGDFVHRRRLPRT